ncbi:MAG: pyridoxal phosphate-dependent aminotransferase [Gemmatimonadota bacterium]
MEVGPNVRELQPSATMAVSALAKALRAQGRDIIDLGAGEPDFRTPDFAAQAGIASIVQGFTHYTPPAGLPRLREAIAGQLAARSQRPVEAAGVVVSTGAKQALFNAIFALFGPGDEVLVPGPYWTSYPEQVKLARATPVVVPTTLADHFKVTPDHLEGAATERTRGLLLNSPSNPTGAVYERAELEAVLRWAAGRGIWVISDEIYGRLVYDMETAPSVLDFEDGLLERVVLVDGASKAFAMTGWRVGFSYCAPALAATFSALQSHVTSGAATASQYAAVAAYSDEPRVAHALHAMVEVFRRRRDRVVDQFERLLPEAAFSKPAGAFYHFFRIAPYFAEGRTGSVAFCRWLIETSGLAVVPGEAFGMDDYARLSFAAADEDINEGIRRLAAAVSPDQAISR